MSDNFRNVSLRLYDIMEHVGASEDMRGFHQSTAVQNEITITTVHRLNYEPVSAFIFGSNCEGTTTPGLKSDIDILYCKDLPVVENIREAANYDISSLMVLDNHTQPGYVKLQSVLDGIPVTVYSKEMVNDVVPDLYERMCINHVTNYGKDSSVHERNGPADTYMGPLPLDKVYAYRCVRVPEFANEWIGRPRPYHWPSANMIDQMKTSGCFVVGVGHPASDEEHIEWKLSFSLQERQLMFSINPVQHKCYILLKMIIKDLIIRPKEKSISSYHCKTCMFHVIENTKACIWRRENLFQCVRLCLIVLRDFVLNGVCPNYFIKEVNMFDRHAFRNVQPRLIELLTQMITEGPVLLLRIGCDQIGDIFMGIANLYAIDEEKKTHTTNTKALMIDLNKVLRNDINRFLKVHDVASNCCWLYTFILELISGKNFNDHNQQQTREAINCMLPFLHSRLAQQTVSKAFNDCVQGTALLPCLLHASYYHFQEGSTCDVTSSRLGFASFLYKLGQYDSCLSLLDQIKAVLRQDVETMCYCYPVKPSGVNTARSLSSTASCVMFLPSEMVIVPTPLQYEMFRSADTPLGSRDEVIDYWYDCAVLDGKVFIHFLEYLVHTKLNKIMHKRLSISNLRWVEENELHLGHRETGYNLLGWISTEENRFEEAIRYCCESWKIKPHHNAAKWHFRGVIDNMLRVQR